jgi:hypothetical protein
MTITLSDECIHLLGYLTEAQWKDAFYYEALDDGELHDLKMLVEETYNMKINAGK